MAAPWLPSPLPDRTAKVVRCDAGRVSPKIHLFEVSGSLGADVFVSGHGLIAEQFLLKVVEARSRQLLSEEHFTQYLFPVRQKTVPQGLKCLRESYEDTAFPPIAKALTGRGCTARRKPCPDRKHEFSPACKVVL